MAIGIDEIVGAERSEEIPIALRGKGLQAFEAVLSGLQARDPVRYRRRR